MGHTVSDPLWRGEYQHLKHFFLFRNFDPWKLRALRFTRFVPDRTAAVGDFGAGQGRALLALYRLGYRKLLAVDTQNVLLEKVRKITAFVPGDVTRPIADLPEASLDAALLFETLHHLSGFKEYKICLTTLIRILKQGGHLFLYEPENNLMTRIHDTLVQIPALQAIPLIQSMHCLLEMEKQELETFYSCTNQISSLLQNLGMTRRLEKSFLNHRVWCFKKNRPEG